MPPPVMLPPADGETLAVRTYWMRAKLAVTDLFPFMRTEQAPVPVQAPSQPVKL